MAAAEARLLLEVKVPTLLSLDKEAVSRALGAAREGGVDDGAVAAVVGDKLEAATRRDEAEAALVVALADPPLQVRAHTLSTHWLICAGTYSLTHSLTRSLAHLRLSVLTHSLHPSPPSISP